MSELIKIGNQQISAKEFKGQRIVTFKDIDLVHERPEGTAGRNFRENRIHFIENEDFFFVKPSDIQIDEFRRTEIQTYEIRTSEINNAGTYLITEQGYLMLVKSFTDDLAWKVQRDLVNTYFNKRKQLSPMEQLKLQSLALVEVDAKIDSVDKDLQEFKQDMPLLGVEESRITCVVRRKGVNCLGGKDSPAYQDKSLRGRVFADIYRQIKREFGVNSYKAIKRIQCDLAIGIIEAYELPFILAEEVTDYNAQMALEAFAV